MNWDAISAIGDMVGATAVVVTLIYLAVQIREGTRATQGVSLQTAAALDQEFLLIMGANPVTASMWPKYLTAPETLPEEQRHQGAFLMTSIARRLENIYLQRSLGTLSSEGWASRQSLFAGVARSAGYTAFLETIPASFMSAEFRDFMETFRSPG